MGIFSAIKDAIFGSDEAEAQDKAASKAAPPQGSGTSGFGKADTKGEAITEVDLEKVLDAKEGADKLNWRTKWATWITRARPRKTSPCTRTSWTSWPKTAPRFPKACANRLLPVPC